MQDKKTFTKLNHLGDFWENFILVNIILVIIQTFLDELAILFGWPVAFKNGLLWASFAFDLLFSAEFIARMIVNGRHGAAKHYLFHQRGWIDFLSSIPLLLFNSAPELIFMLVPDLLAGPHENMAFFGAIKVLKAIRVTRILRLLRVLKILGKIHNTDSHMANRHIAVISTAAIMSIIIVYSAFSFSGALNLNKISHAEEEITGRLAENIEKLSRGKDGELSAKEVKKTVNSLFYGIDRDNSHVLQLYWKNKLILSNFTLEELQSKFHFYPDRKLEERFLGDSNVHMIRKKQFTIFLNHMPYYQETTKVQMAIFMSILLMVVVLMTGYTRHFVQNVTDVVHVMHRGMEDDDFNLEVRINPNFAEDEIYRLASTYNEKWLPMKMKNKEADSETHTGGLSLDDFMN